MPRLYCDVTQLLHWPGNLTGIPRVMYEMAMGFRNSYSDNEVVFVSWVKEIQEFCEVDLDATLSHRGQGIKYYHEGENAKVNDDLNISESTGHSNKSLLQKTVIKAAKKGLRGVAKINPSVSEKMERKAQYLRLKRYKKANFEKDDLLFIPWGEWWDNNFILKLEIIHSQGAKIIQILHDMSPIVVPQFSNSGNATETYPIYCRRVLPITSLVLSVSENSKRDAETWLNDNDLPVPSIKVFRLGDDIKIANPVPTEDLNFKKSGLKGKDYIMCVGTIELKKNHLMFYYAYKLAKSRGIDLPKIVIAGRKGWMSEATLEIMQNDPEVKDKFVFVIEPTDEELSWLYEKCLFTCLPSFYEGWGIPIAESLARGVPCISSSTSSMIEVAPGFVQHFSPYSSDECLTVMQSMLEPENLAVATKKAAHYKRFSWNQSFEQVKSYLEDIK